MISTLVYSRSSYRLIVSKTLIETAKVITDMRGAFHAKDILYALESQAKMFEDEGKIKIAQEIRKIDFQTVCSQLYYDGGRYTGRAPKEWYVLIKRPGGWFVWTKMQVRKEE